MTMLKIKKEKFRLFEYLFQVSNVFIWAVIIYIKYKLLLEIIRNKIYLKATYVPSSPG